MTQDTIETQTENSDAQEERRRKRLLLLLILLLLLLCCAGFLFARYLAEPAPLPDLLPGPIAENVAYPPHYLFSIYGVDRPVGVAPSPTGDRIYVSEVSGERTVKIFDRDGVLLDDFEPPGTTPSQRSPVYLAVDGQGRVFVSERHQHAIFVYDRDGNYLDTILAPDLTLSEYVSKHVGGLPEGSVFSYNYYDQNVFYTLPDQEEGTLPAPDRVAWAPLGLRFDHAGNLWITDVAEPDSQVVMLPANILNSASWQDFNPALSAFGSTGQDAAQFLFPNIAVVDSRGRIFVTDGNNGRISVWGNDFEFMFTFAQGTGEGALSLPRGAWISNKDHLHIADAVGQHISVFDISGDEPEFLFTFGDLGFDDGYFNYPNDIVLDDTGRLYIADRENNRIQVWSY